MVGQMGEDGLVGLPAVGELGRDIEVDRFGGGVGVQKIGDTGAGDDDAGVAVPGGQHAQPAGFEVKGRGVAASRERMKHDRHLELPTLQPISGVHGDLRSIGVRCAGERTADLVGLVTVGDPDCDALGADGLSAGVTFAGADGAPGEEPGGDLGSGICGLGIGAKGMAGR